MKSLSNDMLYAALNQLSVGIIIIDEQQRLVFFNQCISDYSGLTFKENEGKLLADIFSQYKDSRLSDACESALLLGLPTRLSHTFNPTLLPLYQKHFLGNDDHLIQQQISVKRISNNGDKPLCQIVIDNVTHMVKKEKTLKKLADENIEQRKKAEVANISKSQFLANMSHEIRTPINGVLGMLTLLSDTSLNKTQQHFSDLATLSAETLLHLINDILDFSKIEAGKLDIEEVSFNLADCIYESVQTQAVSAQEKSLEIILDTNCIASPFVIGDPARLKQIISNLLSNSIKFTDRGEVFVDVAIINKSEQQIELTISVTDTGIGIPVDKCQQLFNAFTQVDASTTREYGGTGLGLTIVKQLCRLMGGDIEVTSKEGHGSKFTFHINLGVEEPIEKAIHLCSEKPVLIIVSNENQKAYLQKQLHCWQLESVVMAEESTLPQLLTEIENNQFSLLIIDEGIEESLLKQLANSLFTGHKDEASKVQLILLTLMNSRYDLKHSVVNDFKKNNCLHQISKPIKASHLYNMILKILSVSINEDKAGIERLISNPAVNESETEQFSSMQTTSEQTNLIEKTEGKGTLEKVSLLVVEDNRINQEVAVGLLKKMGYHTDVANHGKHALEKLSNSKATYDLILMDCQMPEMDGYQTTEVIRSDDDYKRYRNIKIIAMTANTMTGDQEKCLAVGMNDYLAKPINPSLLSKKLDYWLIQND